MSINPLHLNPEAESAVEALHGGPVPLAGQRSEYVVMRMDVYRELMGVGNDEDLAASLAAIREGLDDVRAGRTRSAREYLIELGHKYEV